MTYAGMESLIEKTSPLYKRVRQIVSKYRCSTEQRSKDSYLFFQTVTSTLPNISKVVFFDAIANQIQTQPVLVLQLNKT